MEKVSGLLRALSGRMQMVQGECEEHGVLDALTRINGGTWHCPVCLERKMAEDRAEFDRVQSLKTRMHAAKIPTKFAGSNFVVRSPDHKAVRQQVKAFRDFFVSVGGWASLVLIGEPGTGKSLLACELIESMIKSLGINARYVTANEMISEIRASYSTEGKTEHSEIARFASYDMLVIDEVDAIPPSPNAALLLNEVYNHRYSNARPVVTISNQAFGILEQFVGSRVYSRLNENMFMCAHTWADERRAA